MVNIEVKFKRVAEAFDDMARDGRRLCESSGSEHSEAAESFTDLSYLVNSFLEKGSNEEDGDVFDVVDDEGNGTGNDGCDDDEGGRQVQCKASEACVEEDLMRLVSIGDLDHVKMRIHAEVENACLQLGGFQLGLSPAGSKRQLMALLRERGLDAGLCKSKWDKKGQCPPGTYEYIDVIVDSARYIVEVSLASEFEIARQTSHYTSLLQLFPTIFVGKVSKVKKIVRLMCNSIKMSMKKDHIHVSPWRRLAYMQAKWFGPYRRTTNEVAKPPKALDTDSGTIRSIGFTAAPATSGFMAAPLAISGYCREDFASRNFVRKVGNLTAAFTTSELLL